MTHRGRLSFHVAGSLPSCYPTDGGPAGASLYLCLSTALLFLALCEHTKRDVKDLHEIVMIDLKPWLFMRYSNDHHRE